MQTDRRNRVIIQNVQPEIDNGRHFIKRVVNEWTHVTADIFSDGHDAVRASLHYRHESAKNWAELFMEAQPNDVWTASFQVTQKGFYHYKLEAWVDHLLNWHNGFLKKQADGQDMAVELLIGADLLRRTAKIYPKAKAAELSKAAELLEKKGAYDEAVVSVLSPDFTAMVQAHPMKQFQTWYDKNLRVRIGRDRAVFSAWYEVFPRSAAAKPGDHGTFKDVERLLPRLQEFG